jgi:uncharacterized protein
MVLFHIVRIMKCSRKGGSTLNYTSEFDRDESNTLHVTGEATVQVPPDQALITLGVITENIDPAVAQAQNAAAIAAIIASLSSLGIPEDHMKTSDYRIHPQYDYVDGKELFKHYKVQHMLEIKTGQIEKVGTIVDTAVKQGANSVSNVRFSLSHQEIHYNRALSLAFENARQKATALAQTARITLQLIPIKIEEIPATQPSIYFQSSLEAKVATPIQPGELTIPAVVKVLYTFT